MALTAEPRGGAAIRLVLIVTSPLTARHLLRGQLGYLATAGFELTIICGPRPRELLEAVRADESVQVLTVPIEREISPLRDLFSLVRLVLALLRLRPDIVNASTPKAGVLGMLAAFIVRVPRRCYTLRGLRLETARGWRRWLLLAGERLAAACAHRVVCVSDSLHRRYRELGLGAGKTEVLGGGSSNGVDLERFARSDPAALETTRAEIGLGEAGVVIGFVGRLTRDKGIGDLVAAFSRLTTENGASLLLLGDLEAGDPPAAEIVETIRAHPRIVHQPHTDDPAPFYGLMDVLVLPSYREGFPNSVLEAAAARVPTVGYRATGLVDAVVDGETGLLAPVGDVAGLAERLQQYLDDPGQRRRHGLEALERARRLFPRERVWAAWGEFYRRLAAGDANADR